MKRILLAEDDRFLRRAAQTKLEQAGFGVETAVDGEEAIAALRREPKPDLLLLDMLMPRKDGMTVLREMRADEALRGIPVVILSNSSKDGEIQKANALGAVHYWIKSNLSLQELCTRVQGLLEQQ